MVLAGELVHAEEVRQQLGLPPTILNINSEEAAAQFAAREASYMQLALPQSAVHFVDTEEAVARQAESLNHDTCSLPHNGRYEMALQQVVLFVSGCASHRTAPEATFMQLAAFCASFDKQDSAK